MISVWISLVWASAIWTLIFAFDVADFWTQMVIATVSLGGFAILSEPSMTRMTLPLKKIVLWGLGSAVLLYFIFFAGDVATRWLPFQDSQVVSIYATKSEAPPWLIGLLLLFVIGPGEEIYWRGFVQQRMADAWGGWTGYLATAGFYALVHVASMNLMLIAAAAALGLVWGWIRKTTGSVLPGVISHAVWDLFIFIIIPLR